MVDVVFVCTGNHCRSPMAEAWFTHLCESIGVEAIRVSSAGTQAVLGSPAHAHAQQALSEQLVELGDFRGRQLDRAMVREADLLVPITRVHRDQIVALEPAAADRTHLLMSFVDESADVEDPLGGTAAAYTACLETMKPALEALLSHITTHHLDRKSSP